MEYFFAIKNFFRNDFVNLTAKSIRHFVPNAKIACLNLYKKDMNEYKNQSFLEVDQIFYKKSKYDGKSSSGQGHVDNSLFFSEGYNYIYENYKHLNCKILMLAEDHFFTNGQTLKEFIEKDFDIACAKWGDGVNGSILGLNLNKNIIFPIPERSPGGVERIFKEDIVDKAKNLYYFSTRDTLDYKGDGFYTNDLEPIRLSLLENKII
jgi:hypothetical protein